jgi:hypothetical protein
MRFELSNVDEKLAKKIKKYCIDKEITQGEWAEKAHNSLIGKCVDKSN